LNNALPSQLSHQQRQLQTYCSATVMATESVSGDEKQNTFMIVLYCSSNKTAGIHGQLTFISALNAFLSITAFLGNALILVALRKESSLHPPSKLLLRCLASTDLCVGLIVEPLYVTLLVIVVKEHWDICCRVAVAVSITGRSLYAVSLLTLTAISVDRLLALLLGLRYRQVVTLKRTYLITITFYVLSTAFSTMESFWNSLIGSWYAMIVIVLCLVTSVFCYTRIFFTLRHHQHQLQDHVQQPNQTNQLNIARYKKAVSSALWLQFMLVVCYLPLFLVTVVLHLRPSSSVSLIWSYTLTLVSLNSSLNPILYCWKIDGVRQTVKDTIRQVLCCWSNELLFLVLFLPFINIKKHINVFYRHARKPGEANKAYVKDYLE